MLQKNYYAIFIKVKANPRRETYGPPVSLESFRIRTRGFFIKERMMRMKRRGIFFIDGFNLYHSIDAKTNLKKYKWLNLWLLCELLLEANEEITDLYYCTAYTYWNLQRMQRHQSYVELNEFHGCKTILGKFQEKSRKSRVLCNHPCQQRQIGPFCEKSYITHEEKMTDVNLAVGIPKACINNSCDAVYLLSGDNDLVPALETVKELYPNIRIRVRLPINAKAKKLMSVCNKNGFKYMRIKESHLKSAQFPNPIIVKGKTFQKPNHWV